MRSSSVISIALFIFLQSRDHFVACQSQENETWSDSASSTPAWSDSGEDEEFNSTESWTFSPPDSTPSSGFTENWRILNSTGLPFSPLYTTETPLETTIRTMMKMQNESSNTNSTKIVETLLKANNKTMAEFKHNFVQVRAQLVASSMKKVLSLIESLQTGSDSSNKDKKHRIKRQIGMEDNSISSENDNLLSEEEQSKKLRMIEEELAGNRITLSAHAAIYRETEESLEKYRHHLGRLLARRLLAGHRDKGKGCGGIIDTASNPTLNFTSNGNPFCFWVVWSSCGRFFNVRTLAATTRLDQLRIHQGFESTADSLFENLVMGNILYTKYDVAVVTYTEAEPEFQPASFSLNFVRSPEGVQQYVVNFKELTASVGKSSSTPTFMSYPGNGQNYRDLERAFFVLKPNSKSSAVTVNVLDLQTEAEADFLAIYEFGEASDHSHTFRYMTRHTGEHRGERGMVTGRPGQPILLYFRSDHSSTRQGFTISYSETDNM